MKTLAIDIETYSSVDLTKSGVYAYAAAPDFRILLFGYAFDDAPVQIVDFENDERLPFEVEKALEDPRIIKTAFNANFERTCIAAGLHMDCKPEQWSCSAVHARYLGLPPTLAGVAKELGLAEQKDSRGSALIRYFCCPCKPTKANGGRIRNLPKHAPDKWETFKEYCAQDVVVEREIRRKLSRFPLPESEQKLWEYDQRINDRGVRVDTQLVENAIKISEEHTKRLKEEAVKITHLENPNSVAQLKAWIETRTGIYPDSLDKSAVKNLLEKTEDPAVKKTLEIRQELGKTSVSKYEAMQRSVCPDGRIRGVTQFYGGSRTGRWAGRLVQLQNLPQNHLKDLGVARRFAKDGDKESLDILFGNIPGTLSELIRTALIPSEGCRFIVSDFSAIEARVIAWMAGEEWRLEVFRTHGKIYEASAAQMFHVPVEQIKKGDPLRQKGKIAELALGYGGSVGAMMSMGALQMGLAEEELQPIVDSWRKANPAICKLWHDANIAAIKAVEKDIPTRIQHEVLFRKEAGILFVTLPSGRKLAYVRPQIAENRFGGKSITYMGIKEGRWTRLETFGGKLVENIIQAIARDCLAVSMIRLEDAGYEINFHVHDEVVLDVPTKKGSVEEVAEIMGRPISWAPGLPLRADGYECKFYRKD